MRSKIVAVVCPCKQLLAKCIRKRKFFFYQSATGSRAWLRTVRGVFLKSPALQVVADWHGETFDLPSGATRLAKSNGCENQAFQIGTSVIGLQFHLEATPASVQDIVSNCRDELVPAQCVQTEKEILSVDSERYNAINQMMDNILSFLQRSNR